MLFSGASPIGSMPGGLRVLRDYRKKEKRLDDHSFMPDNMEDGSVSFFPAAEA